MAEGRDPAGQENGFRGGYNRHWFTKKEKASEYRCGVCEEVFKDPQQIVVCGHQFCRSCLPSNMEKCPACNMHVKANEVFSDESARQNVLALQMRCRSKPCHWKGTLQEFEEKHKNECKFGLVKCSNEACNEMITRENVQKHLEEECGQREIDCRHCGDKIKSADENTHYEKACRSIPVACPQECPNTIPREKVKDHVDKECENTLMHCAFKIVGCEVKVKRSKLQEHEETMVHEHLSQAVFVIDKLTKEKEEMAKQFHNTNNDRTSELRDLNEREETHFNKLDSDFKDFQNHGKIAMENLQKATEQNFENVTRLVEENGQIQEALLLVQGDLTLLTIKTIPHLQSACISQETTNEKLKKMIIAAFSKLSTSLTSQRNEIDARIDALSKVQEGERTEREENEAKTEEEISQLFQEIVEINKTLERQNAALVITKDEMEERFLNHSKQMQLDYDCLSDMITKEKHSRENDLVELNEEIANVHLTSVNTGVVVWRVDNVEAALTKANANQKNALYGKAFSTEPYGYVLQPKIVFNGSRPKDEGFISIFIQILKGKYDPILKWPFSKRIRFTLIEQDSRLNNKRDLQKDLMPLGDVEELRRPTEDVNNGFGIYKFVSHEVLRAGRYVVDDVIFVKIEVLGDFETNEHSETI